MFSAELQLTQQFHQNSNISTEELIFNSPTRGID